MHGKITVTTLNPPCVSCGGMAGYHSERCLVQADLQRRKAEAWDWLEQRNNDVETGVYGNGGMWFCDVDGRANKYKHYEGATLLEAVEAAMKAESREK
jgi:hypothetical protein